MKIWKPKQEMNIMYICPNFSIGIPNLIVGLYESRVQNTPQWTLFLAQDRPKLKDQFLKLGE